MIRFDNINKPKNKKLLIGHPIWLTTAPTNPPLPLTHSNHPQKSSLTIDLMNLAIRPGWGRDTSKLSAVEGPKYELCSALRRPGHW